MTTRFRNPWVDPRVLDVRPADLQAYLRRRGWREADTAVPGASRFLTPDGSAEPVAVVVPAAVDDDSLRNLLVEAVGAVALWEGRPASELLAELLPAPAVGPLNGHPHPQPAANR